MLGSFYNALVDVYIAPARALSVFLNRTTRILGTSPRGLSRLSVLRLEILKRCAWGWAASAW